MRRVQTFLSSITIIAIAAACGSGSTDIGAGDEDEKEGDGTGIGNDRSKGTSSETSATEPFACGSTTCRGDQYCVNPCCGGAPPRPACKPLPADGKCPPGSERMSCTDLGGVDGCYGPGAESCTPPPPYCVDDPATVKDRGCAPHDKTHVMSCVCA